MRKRFSIKTLFFVSDFEFKKSFELKLIFKITSKQIENAEEVFMILCQKLYDLN